MKSEEDVENRDFSKTEGRGDIKLTTWIGPKYEYTIPEQPLRYVEKQVF